MSVNRFVFVVLVAMFSLACGGTSTATDVPAAPAAAATRTPRPVSPTNTPAPVATATTAPAAIGKVGQRIQIAGVALTVVKVSRAPDLGSFLKAKAGNEFVVTDVLIENAGTDSEPYNPLYFKIKDTDGFEYNTAFGAPDPSLKSGDLAKGEKARGNIAFELKIGTKGLVLTYVPIVIFSGYTPIRISLD